MKNRIEVEVEVLNGRRYVRPKGQVGTIGWYPVPWELERVKNDSDIKRYKENLEKKFAQKHYRCLQVQAWKE